MNLPTTLNGYPVIDAIYHGNGYATVMMKRGPADYVVATWWSELRSAWMWGHYIEATPKDIEAMPVVSDVKAKNMARDVFAEVAAMNGRRN